MRSLRSPRVYAWGEVTRLLSLLILLAIGSPLFAQNSQATLTITPNPQPTGIVISSWKIYKAMGTGAAPTTVLTMLPVGTLTYIDTAVTPGNSYSYAATSVSTAGVESGKSNVVMAVIPGTVTPPPPTPLSISTTALPAGTIGTPYSFSLAASGGTAPYSWSASGLPSALTLSKSGVFSGTPVTAGTFPIALTVTDSSSPTNSKSQTESLVINPGVVTSTYVLNASPTSLTFSGVAGTTIASKAISVDDTTPSYPLPISGSTDQKWLSVSLSAQQTRATATVSINSTGMAAGSYSGHVIITETMPEPNGNVVNNSPFSIPVMLTLAAPPTPSVTMTCSGLVCTIVPKNIPSGTPFTVSVSIDGAVVTTTGITSTASAVLHSPKRTGGAK